MAFALVPALQACGGDEPEETTTAPEDEIAAALEDETATAPVTTLEPMATPATPAAATPGATPSGATPAGETAEGETHLVEMNDELEFVPERLTIRVGDTVTWRTVGAVPHTSTCDPEEAQNPEEHVQLPEGAEPWDSSTVAQGEEFSHTLEVPGEYTYFCIPHEANGMVGYLTVEE